MTNRRDLMLGALPGFALFALLTEARAAVPPRLETSRAALGDAAGRARPRPRQGNA